MSQKLAPDFQEFYNFLKIIISIEINPNSKYPLSEPSVPCQFNKGGGELEKLCVKPFMNDPFNLLE